MTLIKFPLLTQTSKSIKRVNNDQYQVFKFGVMVEGSVPNNTLLYRVALKYPANPTKCTKDQHQNVYKMKISHKRLNVQMTSLKTALHNIEKLIDIIWKVKKKHSMVRIITAILKLSFTYYYSIPMKRIQ